MTPVTLDPRSTTTPAPAETCPGVVVWRTSSGRDVATCARTSGHPGDHRDASGYAWNDERWLD